MTYIVPTFVCVTIEDYVDNSSIWNAQIVMACFLFIDLIFEFCCYQFDSIFIKLSGTAAANKYGTKKDRSFEVGYPFLFIGICNFMQS